MLLAGLTTAADWIASNETRFPKTQPFPDDYFAPAQQRAKTALHDVRWKTSDADPVAIRPFADVFEYRLGQQPPRPLRRRVEELGVKLDGPASVLIEAPVGEGKTEAALVRHRSPPGIPRLRPLTRAGSPGAVLRSVPPRRFAEIHTGMMRRFVYDIADLYKTELTVPVAFRQASTDRRMLERFVTIGTCRNWFDSYRVHWPDLIPRFPNSLRCADVRQAPHFRIRGAARPVFAGHLRAGHGVDARARPVYFRRVERSSADTI